METNCQEYSEKSGIYKIINKIDGKVYIGSAKNFKTRYNSHISSLKKNKHYNTFLQASFNKHGEDAFVFQILEVVDGTTEERRQIEQKYISEYFNKWEDCYNLSKEVVENTGPWSYSPELSKEKLSKAIKQAWANKSSEEKQKHIDRLTNHLQKLRSDPVLNQQMIDKSIKNYKKTCLDKYGVEFYSQTEEHKKYISEHCKNNDKLKPTQFKKGCTQIKKGKQLEPISEKTRNKMSEAQRGEKHHMFGKHHSSEVKQKISNSKKGKFVGKKHPKHKIYENIFLVGPNNVIITKIEGLNEFCRNYNIEATKLCAVLKGKRKSHKGWYLRDSKEVVV